MANAWMIKPLVPAAITHAAGTLSAGAAVNVGNDYAGVIWEAQCTTGNAAAVRLDLGADVSFDTILAFGIELLPFAGSTLVINYATAAQGPFTGAFSTDNSGVAYAGASSSPTSGKGVSLWSPATPVTARYVQLTWQASSVGQSVRVGRVVVGKRIQLERNFVFGATFGVRDLGTLDFSRRGVMSRVRGKKLRTVGLTFSSVRKEEVEASTKPLLEQAGNTELIALVTDPAVDALRQTRCYFGPLVGDLGQTWRNAAAWEAKINLVSIF